MTNRRRASRRLRRGSTLIEAVAVVVVLALAVPPVLGWMDRASREQADAIAAARGTLLAQSVLEQVLADCAATGEISFDSLGEPDYLTRAVGGLRPRLDPIAQTFASAGVEYDVVIGPLVAASGATTGQPERDIFRRVTVTATAPSATGPSLAISIEAMVCAP